MISLAALLLLADLALAVPPEDVVVPEDIQESASSFGGDLIQAASSWYMSLSWPFSSCAEGFDKKNCNCLNPNFKDKCEACMCGNNNDGHDQYCEMAADPKDGSGCRKKKQYAEPCVKNWECDTPLYCSGRIMGATGTCVSYWHK